MSDKTFKHKYGGLVRITSMFDLIGFRITSEVNFSKIWRPGVWQKYLNS